MLNIKKFPVEEFRCSQLVLMYIKVVSVENFKLNKKTLYRSKVIEI